MANSKSSFRKEDIAALVSANGLSFLGIAPLQPEPDFSRFTKWLAAGQNAGMTFLNQNLHCRENPQELLSGAKSVILVAFVYGKKEPDWREGKAKIAQYARLRDYHRFIRTRGQLILDQLHQQNATAVGRVLVDSAPMLERALSARFSGGFIGKNTMYIHSQLGSFTLLAELLTSLELPFDLDQGQPGAISRKDGGCGTCRRCQVHCPTGALQVDYTLDANLCLAYWTIEHRGTIPVKFWPWLQYFVFGCDICQNVCPYNRQPQAPPYDHQDLLRVKAEMDLFSVATMSQLQYEQWFGGTPLTRAKRSGLMRNALIAMYVTQNPDLQKAVTTLTHSIETPEVVQQTLKQLDNNPLNYSMKSKHEPKS